LIIAPVALRPALTCADQISDSQQRSPDVSRELSTKAIKCLVSAEDLPSEAERRRAFSEGRDLARRALAADDRNPDAHFALFANEGKLLLMDGIAPNPINLLKASRELDRTLELDPNHPDGLAAKGGLYRQLPWVLGGDLHKAEDCLNRAIAGKPDSINARLELAAMYRDMGQPERARPLLETAAQIAEREGRRNRMTMARDMLHQLEFQTAR
jgi:tetratricopeptide (TPR) repeat protein